MAGDFLFEPDTDSIDDELTVSEDVTDDAPAVVHPMTMPGIAKVGVPLAPRGHGTAIPDALWAMFGDDTEEGR